ncbi:euchromatic histone methyltransferase 1-like protein, partial [Aphelenchoides avenae]
MPIPVVITLLGGLAPEPNTQLQPADPKAKAASVATDEQPRRHPRVSLLPGDKPAKIAASTTKKASPYIVPLVLETRAMTRDEVRVMMRKKRMNAISVNLISPEASRMLKKPSKKDAKKGSCQCIDGCDGCSCMKFNLSHIENCRYTEDGRLDERFLDAKTIVECGGSCGCDRRCRNRATQRDPCPFLELVVTPDKGIGVRATSAIPMHAYVMEYLGDV